MTIGKRHEHGNFCWADLGTRDTAGAKRFYGELFGWSFEDQPGAPGMVYTIAKLSGKEVCGLFHETTPNVPPHWTSYVAVKNADEIAARVRKHGGKMMEMGKAPGEGNAFDVPGDVGRMALFQDPTGAVVAAWQAKKHAGAEVYDQPGSLTWNELVTNDVEKAKEFYSKVFDWRVRVDPDMQYTLFEQGDPQYHTAGMMKIDPKWGPMRPNWAVYFDVANADETADRAKKLGGKVLMPPMDIPKVGRFAWAMDPQGGAFAFIKQVERK
jgi:uncharacterized protein